MVARFYNAAITQPSVMALSALKCFAKAIPKGMLLPILRTGLWRMVCSRSRLSDGGRCGVEKVFFRKVGSATMLIFMSQ